MTDHIFNPMKLSATLPVSTEWLDDFMWPPQEDAEWVSDWLRFDAALGWWLKRDRRFKSGWRPLIEKAPILPDGGRIIRPSGLRTWHPGDPPLTDTAARQG
jgi:hypothetical protein